MPSFVGAGAVADNGGAAGDLTLSPHASTAVGDIMVMGALVRGTTFTAAGHFVTGDDGGRILSNIVAGTNTRMFVDWARVPSGGPDATYTWDSGVSSAVRQGAIATFRSCAEEGDPWEDTETAVSDEDADFTISVAAVASIYAGSMVIFFMVGDSQVTAFNLASGTDPTFANAYEDDTAAGADGFVSMDYGTMANPGNTGTRTKQTDTSALSPDLVGAMLVLKPAGIGNAKGLFAVRGVSAARRALRGNAMGRVGTRAKAEPRLILPARAKGLVGVRAKAEPLLVAHGEARGLIATSNKATPVGLANGAAIGRIGERSLAQGRQGVRGEAKGLIWVRGLAGGRNALQGEAKGLVGVSGLAEAALVARGLAKGLIAERGVATPVGVANGVAIGRIGLSNLVFETEEVDISVLETVTVEEAINLQGAGHLSVPETVEVSEVNSLTLGLGISVAETVQVSEAISLTSTPAQGPQQTGPAGQAGMGV